MSSSKEFKDFVLEQLRDMHGIECRPMMGEFLLYYKGVIFGGIYDDRLLVKRTKNNKKYNMSEEIPYKNGKPMYMVEDLEDRDYMKEVIENTYKDL